MIRAAEQCTVTILGQPYTVVSDEGRSSIEQAAARVDLLMRQASGTARGGDSQRVAVLVSLKLAHELIARESRQADTSTQDRINGLIDLIERELGSYH